MQLRSLEGSAGTALQSGKELGYLPHDCSVFCIPASKSGKGWMITTRPLEEQNSCPLPLCRTGSGCSPLVAALFQGFSGRSFRGWQMDTTQNSKAEACKITGPCRVTSLWLWAELLGVAAGGSTHEQDCVCVDGHLKEVEGRREGEAKTLAGCFLASVAPCCLLHLPSSTSALGPLEKTRSYKSKTMGSWRSSYQLHSHSDPGRSCSQWAPAPSCPTSQTWPI